MSLEESPLNLLYLGLTCLSSMAIMALGLVPGLLKLWRNQQQKTSAAQPSAMLTKGQIQRTLEATRRKIHGRVPADIRQQVRQINKLILEMLPQIDDMDSAEPHIFAIRQTALQYLPETLDNYCNLPRDYALEQPLQNDKTAHQLLGEQLAVLEQAMRDMAQEFRNQNAQKLLIQGRFLMDRFDTATPLDEEPP